MLGQEAELGIARLPGQLLRLFDQAGERGGLAGGRGFDIVVGECVARSIEDPAFQFLVVGLVRFRLGCAGPARRRLDWRRRNASARGCPRS
jgi:hypothetical protein